MGTIELRGVTKTFGGTAAVQDVSLEVRDGEFVTLLGPSGCGKTTTLYLIAGLERPTAGAILLDGRDITRDPPNERDMAIVFQNYALYPHMNVADNIGFSLKLRGVQRQTRELAISHVAQLLRIEALLKRRPSQLSGGQQQRVALARALAKQPGVFLFDEPLSNLDAVLRAHMRTEIRRLHLELGSTSVFVTHDQEEAMTMSDRIAVMSDGRVLQYGTPEELYRRPDPMFVATFVGRPSMNFLDGRLRATDRRVEFDGEGISLRWNLVAAEAQAPATDRATLGVRPEDLQVVRGDLANETGGRDAVVQGEVTLVAPAGADTYVEVSVGTHRLITVRVSSRERFSRGDRVHVVVPYSGLHLYGIDGRRIN